MALLLAVRNRDIEAVRCFLNIHDKVDDEGLASSSLGPSPKLKASSLKRHRKEADLNSRDSSGRHVLHIAIMQDHWAMVELLLKSPRINVNVADVESGWTPLHMAFYHGKLLMGLRIISLRHDCDLSLRDKEGNLAIELLNSTLKESSEVVYAKIGADRESTSNSSDDEDNDDDPSSTMNAEVHHNSVWTWGANANYLLGHASAESIALPERLDFPVANINRPKVALKYLSDYRPKINQLCMSKFHFGVLANSSLFTNGFGADGRLGHGNVDTYMQPRIVEGIWDVAHIALGHDHSVAVTSSGSVFTWGSNKHGQLGYATSDSTDFKYQLEPKEVAGTLKKIRIVCAAASKFHTACFSISGHIYTWGKNLGQLGYQQPLGSIQNVPRKITSFPSQVILQIVATNDATAVLVEAHEVFVFSEFLHRRVVFPHQSIFRKVKLQPVKIVKIVSGKSQFAALSTTGDVWMWVPPIDINYADAWLLEAFPQSAPRRVWSMRKKFMAVKDIAIGIDSCLLICTESGHVYRGARRKDPKTKQGKEAVFFKWVRLPFLQHINSVTACESGGFAALRQDRVPSIQLTQPKSLPFDMEMSIPHIIPRSSYFNFQNFDSGFFDVYFVNGDKMLASHRAVLAARCDLFANAFSDDGSCIQNIEKGQISMKMELKSTLRGKIVEISCNFDLADLRTVLYFLYTGLFDQDGTNESQYPAVIEILRLLKLPDITGSLYQKTMRSNQAVEKMSNDFHQILLDPGYFDRFANVKINLKNGESALGHQVFLSARCPFFMAMIGDDARWSLKRIDDKDDGLVIVNLEHIEASVFLKIMEWLHTDSKVDLFDDVKSDTPSNYMGFIIQVMAAANELLLSSLKDVCSSCLTLFLDLTTIYRLVDVAYHYTVESLKNACLDFACWNIETIIENKLIYSFEDLVIHDIESRLLDMQKRKFPFTRGEDGYYERVRIAGRALEDERKAERREYLLYKKSVSLQEAGSLESLGSGESIDEKCSANDAPEQNPPNPKPLEKANDSDIFEMELEDTVPSSKHGSSASNQDLHKKPPLSSSGKSRKGSAGKWKKLDMHVATEKPPMEQKPLDQNLKPWSTASDTTPKKSLKEIMESETKRQTSPSINAQKKSAAPSPGTSPCPSSFILGSSHPPPIKVTTKMSQKERRRSKNMTTLSSPNSGLPPSISSKPASPWGNISIRETSPLEGSSPRGISFQRQGVGSATTGLSGLSISLKSPISAAATSSTSSSRSPWQTPTSPIISPSLPSASPPSFHLIQMEQQQQQRSLKKMMKKSLPIIQMEEEAISQLKEYYKQIIDPSSGEWFEIERVPPSN